MVHAFPFHNKFIAFDVETSSVYLVDKAAFDALTMDKAKLVKSYGESTAEEIFSELESLENDGSLFSKPQLVSMPEFDENNQPIKSLCLHVAHDCNLRCKYCFADTGEFYGQRMLMSEETAKNALLYVVKNSGKRHNLEVDFFGGEPLMNFDVVKNTLAYGRQLEKEYNKHINFTMTTNGVLLNDEIIDYINDNMFNVVVSIDGRQKVHEAMRPTVNGKSSYDITLKNAQKLIAKRGDKEYYIRGTYTCENLDFAEDVIDMYKKGFRHISIEPVVLKDSDPLSLKKEHLPKIFAEYERLAELMSLPENRDLNFFHFNIDLSNGPCLKRRVKGCGAGVEYIAVSPEGNVYPCHQFVGNTDFIMGNVNEGTLSDDIRREFYSCNIFTKEHCKDCFAKYLCSGGCAANAYNFNGSIYKPHELTCEILKKRTECAIGMFVERKSR